MSHFPRYAIYRNTRMHVLEYLGNDSFILLGPKDERFLVKRSQLIFLKGKKNGS